MQNANMYKGKFPARPSNKSCFLLWPWKTETSLSDSVFVFLPFHGPAVTSAIKSQLSGCEKTKISLAQTKRLHVGPTCHSPTLLSLPGPLLGAPLPPKLLWLSLRPRWSSGRPPRCCLSLTQTAARPALPRAGRRVPPPLPCGGAPAGRRAPLPLPDLRPSYSPAATARTRPRAVAARVPEQPPPSPCMTGRRRVRVLWARTSPRPAYGHHRAMQGRRHGIWADWGRGGASWCRGMGGSACG